MGNERVTTTLPALDAATEAALRASIRRHGVIVPIVVDQFGEVLDGNNRLRIAGELGVDCPRSVHPCRDDAERREVVLSTNDDRRPRLTVEQRRAIVADLRAEGHSQRAIAGAVGASRNVVRTDLKRLGDITQSPDRVIRQGGGTYPASRPTTKTQTTVAERVDAAFGVLRKSQDEVARPVTRMVTRTGLRGAELLRNQVRMLETLITLHNAEFGQEALSAICAEANREEVSKWQSVYRRAARLFNATASNMTPQE